MLAETTFGIDGDADVMAGDPWWRPFVRWETALVVVLFAALLFGNATPNFMSSTTIFYVSLNMGEIAIMALPVTLIVITGEIDLSVASMLGLSSTLLGYLYLHGVPIWLAVMIVMLVGCVGGALNGLLITRFGLPSIAVTIGTLTLFRGIAQIILGAKSVTKFPASLTKIGVQPIPTRSWRTPSGSSSCWRSSSESSCTSRRSGDRSSRSACRKRPRTSPAFASIGSSSASTCCPA